MSSPFPGMDPYLEGSRWQSVHAQLTAEIARQLAPRLRPRYLALTTERVVVVAPEDGAEQPLYPDVGVLRATERPLPAGGVAVADVPLRLATEMPAAVPLRTVEVRDAAERRLVTAIEVLSPTNKSGEGRDEYLRKRNRLLLSPAHLLEIDLLRSGRRVPMRQALPEAPYLVLLSRAETRPVLDVWPVSLRRPLPTVPVPLLAGDADVLLDLQAALTTVYDALGYDLAVDYTRPPEVPLPPGDAAWAEALLRDRPAGPAAAPPLH